MNKLKMVQILLLATCLPVSVSARDIAKLKPEDGFPPRFERTKIELLDGMRLKIKDAVIFGDSLYGGFMKNGDSSDPFGKSGAIGLTSIRSFRYSNTKAIGRCALIGGAVGALGIIGLFAGTASDYQPVQYQDEIHYDFSGLVAIIIIGIPVTTSIIGGLIGSMFYVSWKDYPLESATGGVMDRILLTAQKGRVGLKIAMRR